MRIRIAGTTGDIAQVKDRLGDLLREWDQELTEVVAADVSGSNLTGGDHKSVDPLALAALVLSIPSTALAVVDIADRISKRRRAQEFLEQARELSVGGVTITLLARDGTPEIVTLTPDQLLDRNTEE